MTTAPVTTAAAPTAAPAPANSWSYGALWRRVPRALGYLIPTFVIAIVVMSVLSSLFSTAVSLLIVIVGIFLLSLTLLLARYTGQFEIARLRLSGETPITEPVWPADPMSVGWKRWLRPLANGRYWLALLHAVVIAPIVATISFVVLVVTFAIIGSAVFAPLAILFGWDDAVQFGGGLGENFRAAATVILIVIGVVAIVLLPYVLRVLASR